jgi:hypothetical protein
MQFRVMKLVGKLQGSVYQQYGVRLVIDINSPRAVTINKDIIIVSTQCKIFGY